MGWRLLPAVVVLLASAAGDTRTCNEGGSVIRAKFLHQAGIRVSPSETCTLPDGAQADDGNAAHGLPRTDYMGMLEEESIERGYLRQPFMAENRVYYLSTTGEDRLGLWHPYFHDLRSRGTGIAAYEPEGEPSAGVGNDYSGWEWHRSTYVAVGTVVDYAGPRSTSGAPVRWDNPAPTRMWWRPDKIISEYDLSSPYITGTHPGWCDSGSTWTNGVDWWGWFVYSSAEQCFATCDASPTCYTAIYEVDDNGNTQCWIGPNMLTEVPSGAQRGNTATLNATCYSKGLAGSEPVTVREEKFIALNEVVAVNITASRPVTLLVNGGSFTSGDANRPNAGVVGGLVSLNATCSHDPASDSIRVDERGRALASVLPSVTREGPFVLDGMSATLTSSHPMQNVSVTQRDGFFGPVCDYAFEVPIGGGGGSVSLAWAMDDTEEYTETLQRARAVATDTTGFAAAKTSKMNGLLNDVVPYFRCSDHDIVKVYYYLWSVYLMLYIDVGEGLESHPHTQSAANNFLGMHRFDAVFQIMAGAWTAPNRHDFYANGNVLVWEGVYDRGLNNSNMLPDNFGIDWGSAVYGNEINIHIIGALDVYQHSGDRDFLRRAYSFYKKLYWNNMFWIENCFNMAYDAVLALNTMAEVLGMPEDAVHWNATSGMQYWSSDFYQNRRNANWADANNWDVHDNTTAFGWLQIAALGIQDARREWVENMGRTWLLDSVMGHFDIVPLASVPLKNYHQDDDADGNPRCPLGTSIASGQCSGGVDKDFTIVPDGNFYMIRPLYMHKVSAVGNKALLAHLKRYNMENGIPVAPEARRLDLSEFGNQFNNFNAGKLLLYLQGLGGLRISNVDDSFTFASSLPSNWTFMEFRVPVSRRPSESSPNETVWVTARVDRERVAGSDAVTKRVTVRNNPFSRLLVQPWADGATVVSSSPAGGSPGRTSWSTDDGHVEWTFQGSAAGNATVEMELDYAGRDDTDGGEAWDGSLAAEGLTTKFRDYYACQPNCLGSPQF